MSEELHLSVLTLEQAAEFLHLHPVTLQRKARRGEVPASKPGKRWVFLEIDLVAFLRAQYSSRVMQGVHKEVIYVALQTQRFFRLVGQATPQRKNRIKKHWDCR